MLNTIVVALDSSDTSECVIQGLKCLQIQPSTKIILCHVLPSPDTISDLPPDRPSQPRESVDYAEKQLHAYQAQLPNSEVEIVSGDPAEEIVRLANIYHADLIAIGSRGLTGFKRIVENSVSSQVVADAPCAVLVIKNR